MNSALLLHHYEHCNRDGFWSRDWERYKIDSTEMMRRSIRAGLTSSRPDFGECAGEEAMGLGGEPGLDSKHHNLYDQVVHLGSISDIVCHAIRKSKEPPWLIPDPVALGDSSTWTSAAYLAPDGSHLRRVCLVSGWSDDRHFSEARSWFSMGEVCAYNLPMKQAVVVLGSNRDGKRHGHWSRAVLHPVNRKLRFRKRTEVSTGFKNTWVPIFREDRDEITTTTWLQSMLDDGVLQDSLFTVDIPVPSKEVRQRILDLAARKLERILKTKTIPDQQLSTCDYPVPCVFRSNCHKNEEPSGRFGFVRIDQLPTVVPSSGHTN
jgi:hypothetical protein